IKDNGIGMSPEFAQKIFEPFERERTSTVSRIQGTGLGMAIAQSVVKAHKGFICATDSQGGGLTLTVVLPIAPLEPKIAVDEPPQDAKAERKAERNKAKQEKQQARQHKSE
ncbi:MAG: ATP-binding protein, partial [Bifidobacterium bifidum]|nr:ATP-binding protein [Bifidobacterium bifidum]